MLGSEKISLKTFWETIEQQLATYSADELRAILRAMARETPPTGRQAFLEKLKPVEGTATAAHQAIEQEELLAEIDDLIQEIKSAMEQADDWEERYQWGEYYDDEDSLGPYAKFIEPLTELFDRTEATFDYGHLPLARTAYQKLLEVLDLEDDYGRGVRDYDLSGVDIDEARARYLRTVYETEPAGHRPQVLFEQMQQVQLGRMRPRLMLENLIQISPQPLPDWQQFLEDWIAFLRPQTGGDADAWLREAVRLSQGAPGLAELARAEGKTRPRAYLDWFTMLVQAGKYHEILLAAQEALQMLPAQLPIRAAIADHLAVAAVKLNETKVLRAGRWEAFLAKPTLSRLLDLWETTFTGEERITLMRRAVQHIQDYLAQPPSHQIGVFGGQDDLERPVRIDKSVLAHAYFLAGELEGGHQLAANEKVLGWSNSDNPQGLVVSFFLVLLSGRAPETLPPNLAQFWEERLSSSVGFWFIREEKEDSVLKRLERVYTELFAQVSLSDDREEGILSWCLDVARQRVNAIVGGQHRKSYDKAARLTVACAEMLQLRESHTEANSLVNEIRNHFPRHRAFQSELKAALRRKERDQGR